MNAMLSRWHRSPCKTTTTNMFAARIVARTAQRASFSMSSAQVANVVELNKMHASMTMSQLASNYGKAPYKMPGMKDMQHWISKVVALRAYFTNGSGLATYERDIVTGFNSTYLFIGTGFTLVVAMIFKRYFHLQGGSQNKVKKE